MADSLTCVLVEGASDRVALETLAGRLGRDLGAEGVSIVVIGGAHAIGRFLDSQVTTGVRLAGLCDAGEERVFRRALERSGVGKELARPDLERLGFFVCEADLEDELIRALGTGPVEDVLRARGDLRSFRTFQKQPAQQGRAIEAQLRRFLGTHSGRKAEYAEALVRELDLAYVPRPLERLLTQLAPPGTAGALRHGGGGYDRPHDRNRHL